MIFSILGISDFILAIIPGVSGLTNGSPPVIRNLLTPSSENIFVNLKISDGLNALLVSIQLILSETTQYRQRRLHLSVTEIRKLVCNRPN